jgi:hypothetical protein
MFKINSAKVAHVVAAIVFVPVATWVNAYVVKHFPGMPHFTSQQIADESYVAALAAAGLALHYLKGLKEWQKLEATGIIADEDPATSGRLRREQRQQSPLPPVDPNPVR